MVHGCVLGYSRHTLSFISGLVIWRSFTIPNCLCGEKALPREVVLPLSLKASEIDKDSSNLFRLL